MSTPLLTQAAAPDRERRQAERAAYAAAWPFYCHYCEGAGFHNVLGGDEECSEVESDLCPCCTVQGRCPRCAAILGSFLFCSCGWSIHDPTTAMPSEVLDYGATDINDTGFTDPFAEEGE